MFFVVVQDKGVQAVCDNLQGAKECLLNLTGEAGTYYLVHAELNQAVDIGNSDESPFCVIVRDTENSDKKAKQAKQAKPATKPAAKPAKGKGKQAPKKEESVDEDSGEELELGTESSEDSAPKPVADSDDSGQDSSDESESSPKKGKGKKNNKGKNAKKNNKNNKNKKGGKKGKKDLDFSNSDDES